MGKKVEEEGLVDVLKKLIKNLPCCEMMICFFISVVLTIMLSLSHSQVGWNNWREMLSGVWSDFASISVSLSGLIMAVLAIVYTIGGKRLNTSTNPAVFSVLASVMTVGVFLHLLSMTLSLGMIVNGSSLWLGIAALFFFVYSIVMTLNILVHLFAIHSSLK